MTSRIYFKMEFIGNKEKSAPSSMPMSKNQEFFIANIWYMSHLILKSCFWNSYWHIRWEDKQVRPMIMPNSPCTPMACCDTFNSNYVIIGIYKLSKEPVCCAQTKSVTNMVHKPQKWLTHFGLAWIEKKNNVMNLSKFNRLKKIQNIWNQVLKEESF